MNREIVIGRYEVWSMMVGGKKVIDAKVWNKWVDVYFCGMIDHQATCSVDRKLLVTKERDIEAALLADIGEGGFCADEFELVQKLGHLSIQMFQQRGNLLESSQVRLQFIYHDD